MLSLLIAAAVAQSAIDSAVLSNDIKILVSDAFEGRGPGTGGEQKPIDYLRTLIETFFYMPAARFCPLRRCSRSISLWCVSLDERSTVALHPCKRSLNGGRCSFVSAVRSH